MRFAVVFIFAALLAGQTAPPSGDDQEAQDLSRAVSEAGSSGVDFVRGLEAHLRKYPQSKQRLQIEKALAKSAVDSNDNRRIILYGESVLKAEPASEDLQLLEHVTRALLESADPSAAARALIYAKRYEGQVEALRSKANQGHMSEAQWSEEVDKNKARAIVLEARATGDRGNFEEALKLARGAWDLYPGPDGAREVAQWLSELGRNAEAIDYYADAFAMEDARTAEPDRARDRRNAGDLYAKVNGSEKGLGDVLLQAYDRTAALKGARIAKLKIKDPNIGASEVVEYTLPAVEGGKALEIASLKGKAIVMDFWATWCGPCRVQHPMIEAVKKRYAKTNNVVFVSVNGDDDHSLVPGFLKEMHWDAPSYYDAGLSHLLNISSIPTVIVLDPAGRISSRMAGFIPERFEEMLTQRIDDSLKN